MILCCAHTFRNNLSNLAGKTVKLLMAGATVSLSLGMVNTAHAATITLKFDELGGGNEPGKGEILNTQYSNLGVEFSNSVGSLRVQNTNPGSPFSGTNSIWAEDLSQNYNQATFSVAVDFVSLTIGDWGADRDDLLLELYDASNNLLTHTSVVLPASVYGGLTLSASAPSGNNVAYARFYGSDFNGNNTVGFDNFTFGTAAEPTSVPEPTSGLALVGFGAGATTSLLKRQRQQKKTTINGKSDV